MSSAELDRKLHNSLKENAILTKQLEHYKRDHGELILSQRETERGLAESQLECRRLKDRLAGKDLGTDRLKSERDEWELKFRNSAKENEILSKQLGQLKGEFGDLLASKAASEAELRRRTEEMTTVNEEKREMCRREKEAEERSKRLLEQLEMAKKLKKEDMEVLANEKRKLERDLKVVMDAATNRFRDLQKRMSEFEIIVAALSDSPRSGPLSAGTNIVTQQLESLGSDAKIEGHAGSQSGETAPSEEKTASSMPCTDKSASAPPPIVYLSDDGEELPLSKVFKRKLSSEVTNVNKVNADSTKVRAKQLKYLSHQSVFNYPDLKIDSSYSKQNLEALKRREKKCVIELAKADVTECLKIQDESGCLNKEWEYEADMLDALGRDTELCMKAVSALYRHQTALDRSSTVASFSRHGRFSELSALRVTTLAGFLVDGRKSVVDLEKFDPKGADECRRIAFGHSKQLFEIYKSKDPFFSP